MSKDLIEINYAEEKDVWYRDFGQFSSPKTIKVDRKEWTAYILARARFELLHKALERKVGKK